MPAPVWVILRQVYVNKHSPGIYPDGEGACDAPKEIPSSDEYGANNQGAILRWTALCNFTTIFLHSFPANMVDNSPEVTYNFF